jgi:hypothetical protein
MRACDYAGMRGDDVPVTVRLPRDLVAWLEQQRLRTGNDPAGLIEEALNAERRRGQPPAPAGQGGAALAAAILERAGIDPAGPEHQAAAARARADIHRGAQGAA